MVIVESINRSPAIDPERRQQTASRVVTKKDVTKTATEPRRPDFDSLLVEVTRDASEDPLHYLLRSNRSHDGE